MNETCSIAIILPDLQIRKIEAAGGSSAKRREAHYILSELVSYKLLLQKMITNSDTISSSTTPTLRSRSHNSTQSLNTQIKNDQIQPPHRNERKTQHRIKSKIILLIPTVLVAISSLVGLSVGQIVSNAAIKQCFVLH